MNIGNFIKRFKYFSTHAIWDVEISSLSLLQKITIAILRVFYLIVKGFKDDECSLHASALTFNTLMAIVPVLALSLALARAFGGDELARTKLKGLVREWTTRFDQQEAAVLNAETRVYSRTADENGHGPTIGKENEEEESVIKNHFTIANRIEKLVDVAFDRVAGISFAALGVVGVVILFFTVIQGLSTVENTFNKIWGIVEGRPLWRRITDYLSVVIILPFLFVAASSLPLVEFICRFLSPYQAEQLRLFMISGAMKKMLVFFMTGITFTFIIMFMPNVKVRALPGIVGGFISGSLFLLWLWACASFQIWVAGYGRIYGSFALFPILLAWVFVSWQIVLFGAETAFSIQNFRTYKMEEGAHRASFQSKFILALAILTEASRTMIKGTGAFSVSSFSATHGVPVRLLNEVADILVRTGFFAEIAGEYGRYTLIKHPHKIFLPDVLKAIMALGVPSSALGLTKIESTYGSIANEIVYGNKEVLTKTLGDLAEKNDIV